MVYLVVINSEGKWQPGISLEYGNEAVELNHISYSHCGDYNSRVIGFFTGVDAWGKTHRMAKIEEFLARDTTEYLKQHGLSLEATNV